MSVDDVIVRGGPVAVPLDYKVPTGTEIVPLSLSAVLNGAAAGSAYVPALEVIAPSGAVTAYCARQVEIDAGASVLCSWFPGVAEADDEASSSSSTAAVASVTSPLGTLSVNNPAGPAVNVDLPDTGVTAGPYGDASHSAALTVDAEGRITAASSVAIAGGSGTIGFEVGYDQITASVNIGSVSEAAPTTVISCAAHTFDGAAVLLTVFFPFWLIGSSAAQQIFLGLSEGGTRLTRLASLGYPAGSLSQLMPVTAMYRFTPTAAAHTYTITAWSNSLTGTPQVGAGLGGAGAYPPGFARFTKV